MHCYKVDLQPPSSTAHPVFLLAGSLDLRMQGTGKIRLGSFPRFGQRHLQVPLPLAGLQPSHARTWCCFDKQLIPIRQSIFIFIRSNSRLWASPMLQSRYARCLVLSLPSYRRFLFFLSRQQNASYNFMNQEIHKRRMRNVVFEIRRDPCNPEPGNCPPSGAVSRRLLLAATPPTWPTPSFLRTPAPAVI